MAQKKTNEEFVKDVYLLVGDDYVLLSNYINSCNKVTFKHMKCGTVFHMLPGNFLNNGQRCPSCGQKSSWQKQTRTHQEFLDIVEELTGVEYSVLSTYEKSQKNILMKHNKCGHTYSVRPGNFIHGGKRCPKCALEIGAVKRAISKTEYEKRLATVFGEEYTVLEYKSMKHKALICHNKCGKAHMYSPHDLLQGGSCVYCGKLWKKTHEYFIHEVKNIVGDEYAFKEQYHGADNPILVRHNLCGYEYKVRPANFLHGKRCPACMESGGERAITDYLKKKHIEFSRQYKFNNCVNKKKLRFDFAVFNNDNSIKCLIEYDGRQHYEPIEYFGGVRVLKEQQKRDKIKNAYCENNNLRLIRIPYTEIENIEQILKKCL